MAPIKFEDQLKEKLDSRSLEPSPEAWSALQHRLDAHEKESKTSRFWWIGIAASIIGVVFIITQFNKNTSNQAVEPIIVTNEIEPNTSEDLTKDEVTKNVSDQDIEVVMTSDSEKLLEVKSATEMPTKVNATQEQHRFVVKLPSENTVASNGNSAISKNTEKETPVKVLSAEDLKVIEVVAEIKAMQKAETSVSDREIDSLLKQAQREILKQKIFDEKTQTVSADALLQDVEVELEQSFRTRVFEALRDNFSSVKTAVAERNN